MRHTLSPKVEAPVLLALAEDAKNAVLDTLDLPPNESA
jgi:hypothetical protein